MAAGEPGAPAAAEAVSAATASAAGTGGDDAAASRPTDEEILTYETQVKDSAAKVNELVSVPLSLRELEAEFKDNPPFLSKIRNLEESFSHFRRCRGDGNCFYRAFVFAWFERVLVNPERYLATAKTQLADAKTVLLSAGFQLLVIEDFLDVAEDTLRALENGAIFDRDMLLSRFQADEVSNALVVLFRFVTSAYLQKNADEYAPFLLDYVDEMGNPASSDMPTFCAQQVEAMGRESDHLQIIAIARQLAVNVAVVYLDSGAQESATIHRFDGGKESDETIHLLFRPGHYDLIYKRDSKQ